MNYALFYIFFFLKKRFSFWNERSRLFHYFFFLQVFEIFILIDFFYLLLFVNLNNMNNSTKLCIQTFKRMRLLIRSLRSIIPFIDKCIRMICAVFQQSLEIKHSRRYYFIVIEVIEYVE